MRYIKKPIPSQVEFAEYPGTLQTLEGPVAFEVGDALMTGAAGEHWPISRSYFHVTYDPIPPTRMGEKGLYLKKRILVEARQTSEQVHIPIPEGRGTLVARPGDWILTAADGHQWVVANDIFLQTYQRALE